VLSGRKSAYQSSPTACTAELGPLLRIASPWIKAGPVSGVDDVIGVEKVLHSAEQDKLVSAVIEERLSMRNRAITVLARERRYRVARKLISVHRQEDGG
jgi:hypothetical protein